MTAMNECHETFNKAEEKPKKKAKGKSWAGLLNTGPKYAGRHRNDDEAECRMLAVNGCTVQESKWDELLVQATHMLSKQSRKLSRVVLQAFLLVFEIPFF